MVPVTVVRGWDLEIDRGPDWLYVRPRPTEGPAGYGLSLADQVWSVLEETLMHRLVLELSDITQFDETLVEQLRELQRRVQAHEGIMRLCCLSSENERKLRKHDVAGQLACYCNRESAVMGHDRPRLPR